MNVMGAVMNMLHLGEVVIEPHDLVTPARLAGYKAGQLGKIENLICSTRGKPALQFECSHATVTIFLDSAENGLKDMIKKALLEMPINLPEKWRGVLQVAFKGGKVGGREDEMDLLKKIGGN